MKSNNMTIEGMTIKVKAEDVLYGKVTVDEVVEKIFEITPSFKIGILDLKYSPMKVEVEGELTPYTLETMPDDFTKKDALEYNENIELVEDFVNNVYREFQFKIVRSDDLIKKIIINNNPCLSEKDVDAIMKYSNEYDSYSYSERLSMIDTFTDLATEILENHGLK